MKPRLGRTVYTVYDNSITKTKVAFIGKDSFIIEHFITHGYDYGFEYYYDDYKESWFTNLSEAKQSIMSTVTEKVIWKPWSTGDYWELIYDE